MDSKNILTLFELDYECINVTQEIVENDKEYVIYAEALIDFDRNCPKYGQKGQVKDFNRKPKFDIKEIKKLNDKFH